MTKPGAGGGIRYNLLLGVVIALLFLLNFYSETLFYRPSSVHQWRQADCLSITKNYYEEGLHFFEPRVHTQMVPDGKAVSEFPILNYTVACLWKLVGEHEFIYRLLEYFIYLLAIFTLFNTLLLFFKKPLLVFFMVSVLLTSPLLTYYSFNFLSDVPALSFCILSFCYLFRFYKTKAVWYFYFALILATLAVLLKASALMAFICLLFLLITDLLKLNRLFKVETLFKNKSLPLVCTVICIFLIASWYRFAMDYNAFNNGLFLLTILPIWDMPDNAIYDTARALINDLLPVFLNRPMLAFFSLAVLFVLVNIRKLDVFLRCSFLFSGVFSILYTLFFFKVFIAHDYYLVNLFIFPVILFFCLADLCSKLEWVPSKFVKSISFLLFILNSFYAAAFYRLRMIGNDKLCVWYPFISNEEKRGTAYINWCYSNNIQGLEDIRPDLRHAGIKREDVVVCTVDDSPNISLYFMDQKGYTVSEGLLAEDSLILKRLLSEQAHYLVLTRQDIKNKKAFQIVEPQLQSIFKKSHVEVFKVKN